MELSMKKFTVRRFFSVYLRKKSRSKSSSLSRLEHFIHRDILKPPGFGITGYNLHLKLFIALGEKTGNLATTTEGVALKLVNETANVGPKKRNG
ncbi:hypothetical protein H671_2g5358 [Cricetulus griseus]|nr:hypothetical protein H671_2g5358 [Cricetulus griseus]